MAKDKATPPRKWSFEDTPQCHHTPCPKGYLNWHAWAENMGKTHTTIRCEHCGLWAIWIPKEKLRAGRNER